MYLWIYWGMIFAKCIKNDKTKSFRKFDDETSFAEHLVFQGVQPGHCPNHHGPHLLVATHAQVTLLMFSRMPKFTIAECSRACTRLWACKPRWLARRRGWTTSPSGSSTASSSWTSFSSSTPRQTSSSTSLPETPSETRFFLPPPRFLPWQFFLQFKRIFTFSSSGSSEVSCLASIPGKNLFTRWNTHHHQYLSIYKYDT